MPIPTKFLRESEKKSFSAEHRETMKHNIGKYDAKVIEGKKQFEDLEKVRKLAKNIKWYAMENLSRLLLEFESKFKARGGKVIWAATAAEAREAVMNIVLEKKAKAVVKGKSMMSEELRLNTVLKEEGVEAIETDLGEFIVQELGQKPYHIVTPAMHLRRSEIAELFHKRYGTSRDASSEELTDFVRQRLRKRFQEVEIGITGANFIVADTGSIVLTENEGNIRLATSLPKTHIAIVGIDKMIPNLQNLHIFLPLLATYGTGQKLTVYNTILSGPRQAQEHDGPEEMYVILVDNGRSKILADPEKREALYCIRCGSCLNACPIYNKIGGHTYDTPYGGPIGAVIMPYLEGFEKKIHLSNASSLCGKCTEVCPVNIELHQLLLHNRKIEADEGYKDIKEDRMWRRWEWLMRHRSWLNAPRFAKNAVGNLFLQKMWGERREFPPFPKNTFNQLWKKGKV